MKVNRAVLSPVDPDDGIGEALTHPVGKAIKEALGFLNIINLWGEGDCAKDKIIDPILPAHVSYVFLQREQQLSMNARERFD
jgi:hypothetical protein